MCEPMRLVPKSPLIAALLLLIPGVSLAQSSSNEVPLWEVAATPILEIGSMDGEGADVFGSVAGVVRTAEGGIVVADGLNREVKFFDASGQHYATSGRMGEGPGEFRTMRPPLRCGTDEVLVWDPNLSRISGFSEDGSFEDSYPDSDVRPAQSGWSLWRMACNRDGVIATVSRNAATMRPTREGPLRVEVRVEVIDAARSEATTLGTFPGDDFYFAQGMVAPRPLGLMTRIAVGTERMYVATGETSEIAVYSLDGQPRGSLETGMQRQVLDDQLRDAFVDDAVMASRNGESSRPFHEGLEYPDALPAYAKLLVDDADNLWVQEYPIPGGRPAPRLTVFSPDGRAIGRVELPEHLDIFEVGSDWILGAYTDEVGTPFVRVYGVVPARR